MLQFVRVLWLRFPLLHPVHSASARPVARNYGVLSRSVQDAIPVEPVLRLVLGCRPGFEPDDFPILRRSFRLRPAWFHNLLQSVTRRTTLALLVRGALLRC